MEFRLAFIGFGNVGQELARLLLRKRQHLAERYDLSFRTMAIATGSHGAAINPDGIDLEAALARADAGASVADLSASPAPSTTLELIEACGADVLFENTPVDYESGQPALDHLRRGLESGMHALTANKGPVVHGYTELRDLADSRGLRFLFEPTVMDGAPLFSLWRALPAAELHSLRGVLNSTTNLILERMEAGSSFETAVAHAQDLGIAETDPSGDVDGWDAAVKVAALVTVMMEVPLLPQQVERSGIRSLGPEQIEAAQQAGTRWKLVCRAERGPDGVQAVVAPEQVGAGDPLYHVTGTSSALTLHTDVLGDLTVTETDPGPHTTAYGLLADFLRAADVAE